MKKFDRAFRSAATKLANAAAKTSQDLSDGLIPDEPSFTSALVARFRDALDGYSSGGIAWSAKILSSHGPNSEEKVFGADFLGVVNLTLPGYQIKKGFLAQAKRQEPGSRLSSSEWNRLNSQCESMLRFTPESFVFVYALNGVFMLPAISVIACSSPQDLHTLHPKSTGGFYKEHFQCFIGDGRIDSASPAILDNLKARYAIEFGAATKGEVD
jgi:hypothetical protein